MLRSILNTHTLSTTLLPTSSVVLIRVCVLIETTFDKCLEKYERSAIIIYCIYHGRENVKMKSKKYNIVKK